MTPKELEAYLMRLHVYYTYEYEYAWYLLRAFQGKAGQDTFSSRPNMQERS